MPSSYVLLDDLRMHYLHWNLKGNEPTFVLLHGLASNARIWELVAPILADQDFKALAPDARGHGLTDKPATGYDFDSMTRDLAMFIQTCRLERPILVGHSWGGSRAVDYAARFPYGPYSPSGIVLLDGGMVQLDDTPFSTWESVRARLTPPDFSGTPLEVFSANLQDWTSSWLPPGEQGERIMNIILANFAVDENERVTPHLELAHHMEIVRAMWEFQTYERLTQVRCPTLMLPVRTSEPTREARLFGKLKERGLRRARDSMEKLEISWLEDTIHDVPLHKPALIAELLTQFFYNIEQP